MTEAVDVDHGKLVGRRLEDVPVVMGLDELAPVGWREKWKAVAAAHRDERGSCGWVQAL